MQPIVVAVDFSNTSIHALEYTIPLANRLKSDIVMVWVDKVAASEGIYTDTSNENRTEAKKRFEELIRQYEKEVSKEIKLDYKLRKGKIYHELDGLARTIGAMMIVTGAHGISGFEEFWIGSNAFKIVTYATCPVITVRHDFPVGKNIDRILVPVDSSIETLQKFPFIAKLAEMFGAEVHVVATHYSQLKSIQRVAENLADQGARYLGKHKVRMVRDKIISNDITKMTIDYATNMNADLISIMTEQETPANILLGPHAQQLINQSPVPILSIHPVEHFCL
ncbi:MAG: universal stress protein [Bacteroidetes bacterium]|nr:universal stress protein [Bacteroidota bacterium]